MFNFTFENSLTEKGVFYSRYIASWLNEGGTIKGNKALFMAWLIVGCDLTPEEATDIYNMATNGKLELETSARDFMLKKEN